MNAELLNVDGESVRVMLAEHLVAIMLKTGRLKDRARVQMFLSQDAVDGELLADIVRRHGLQDEWADFEGEYLE